MSNRPTAYLEAHDFRVAVPDGEADDPDVVRAEHDALLASPAFQARLERAQRDIAAGRSIPAEEVDRHIAERDWAGYSGQLRVRLPKHLHRELAEQAHRDGVSLNTLIVGLLERGVGAVKGLVSPETGATHSD